MELAGKYFHRPTRCYELFTICSAFSPSFYHSAASPIFRIVDRLKGELRIVIKEYRRIFCRLLRSVIACHFLVNCTVANGIYAITIVYKYFTRIIRTLRSLSHEEFIAYFASICMPNKIYYKPISSYFISSLSLSVVSSGQ